MSTKSSIMCFDGAHLYREAFEDDVVYLELEKVQFEASNGRIQVQIPVSTWETLRAAEVFTPSYIDKTEEALIEEATADIDKRLSDYNAAKQEGNERKASLLGFLGCLTYGSIDLPRQEQIDNTVRAMLDIRAREIAIAEQIKNNFDDK